MRPFQMAPIRSSLVTTRSRLTDQISKEIKHLWGDSNHIRSATEFATGGVERVLLEEIAQTAALLNLRSASCVAAPDDAHRPDLVLVAEGRRLVFRCCVTGAARSRIGIISGIHRCRIGHEYPLVR